MQKTLSVVNLTAIRSNAEKIKSLLHGKKFYAVVKADAYGHGAVEVSREIEDIVDGFCVAIADEGAALRIGGITKPILVFSPLLGKDDVSECAFYDLAATVNGAAAAKLIGGLPCHIKINTGMNRYGCNLNELEEALEILDKSQILGVYSHLYAADDAQVSKKQLCEFLPAVKAVKAVNPEAVAHISASGGILRGGEYLLDGVRAGIMLYGYSPSGFTAEGLTPALKVYARLSQETSPVGGGVGYNSADKNYEKLYTYRLGYADGFSRNCPLGEKTLCMDAFISQEKQPLMCVMDDARAYAERLGTISYEALCSVTRRSQRIYER